MFYSMVIYITKEEALEAVKQDGFNLEYASKELRNDRDKEKSVQECILNTQNNFTF